MRIGGVHHIEIWVPSLERAEVSWGWLLETLGYTPFQEFDGGRSWKLDDHYIVIEASPDVVGDHDRLRAGLNHLAFHAGPRAEVDRITDAALENGWTLLFADRHPFAAGPDYYAAYLENSDGFEVELVADVLTDG